jgi:hypothetical protein
LSGGVSGEGIEHQGQERLLVTLTDAATCALDWDSGINFQVTLTTNRVLGKPRRIAAA